MATVPITPTAQRNLVRLIETHTLPSTTIDRFRRSLEPLRSFPLLGAPLEGRWVGFRFVLGPWRWMIVVYRYDAPTDEVQVVTVKDARSARAATSG
ncbi:MAG: type II toxin-antitoxin system RelE/ParE family toxin [Candidatus Limnocylindrales bacterium]